MQKLIVSPLLVEELCPRRDSCSLLQDALSENEKLREIFQFAIREFEERNRRIASLSERLDSLNLRIKGLEQENQSLRKRLEEKEATNKLLQKMLFGRKSERGDGEKIRVLSRGNRGARIGHPGYGRKIPEGLPVREQIIEIPEEERFCPHCRKPYEETGMEDVSSEICVEKTYYLKKIRRKIYKKTCSCAKPIVTSPVAPKLIPRGKFGISFWVDILIQKYQNHMPIERQISELRDYGLKLSPGTIFGGLKNLYLLYLEPLYQSLTREIRNYSHYHIDESGWHLFVLVDDKENYHWFIWVYITKEIVLFVLHPTRSSRVPYKILFDIEPDEIKNIDQGLFKGKAKKLLNVDKFSSYKVLERMGLVELSFCWAHQRREFLNLGAKYPELSPWVEEWIERIGNLYHLNNERIRYEKGEELFEKYDAKLREAIGEIDSLTNTHYSHPAQNGLISSMKEHRKGLTLFVDHPEIPMDNNIAERMLRHMVLGRNNYWGNHSLWAGWLTCLMFSLVQTCLQHGISPRAYLTYYLTECAKRGDPPSEEEIVSFLPHRLNEEIKEKLKINTLKIFEGT